MTPQQAHALVGHAPEPKRDVVECFHCGEHRYEDPEIERLRRTLPDISDHAAIDAIASRAGLHRGVVAKVIEAIKAGNT